MNTILPPFSHIRKVNRPLESIASKKMPPFMTLIVAVKTRDAVIIAADSQISFDHSSKRMDIQKIEQVKFQNFPALVALADNVTNCHRFVDILKTSASESAPKTAYEAGLIIQNAMRTLRNEIGEIYHTHIADELDKIIRERNLNCSITVGFCLNREPHLIQTNLLEVSYAKSTAEYETDGCGAALANFILAECYVPKSDFKRSALIAVYAVWTVIKYDRYCEGPIVVHATSYPGLSNADTPPRIIKFPQELVNDLVSIIEKADAATKKTRRDIIGAEFDIRTAEAREKLDREIDTIPPEIIEYLDRLSESDLNVIEDRQPEQETP